MSSDAGFQAIARQRLRLGTPQEVNVRYLCSGVLVKNENGNFLKLIYETVENLLIFHMLRLQILFQECRSWFNQDSFVLQS